MTSFPVVWPRLDQLLSLSFVSINDKKDKDCIAAVQAHISLCAVVPFC